MGTSVGAHPDSATADEGVPGGKEDAVGAEGWWGETREHSQAHELRALQELLSIRLVRSRSDSMAFFVLPFRR